MEEKHNFEGSYQRQGSTFTNENGIQFALASRKNFECTMPREFIVYRIKDSEQTYFFSRIYRIAENTYKAEHNKIKYTIVIDNNSLDVKIQAQQKIEQPLTPLQQIMFNAIKKLVELNQPYKLIQIKLLQGLNKSNKAKHKAKIKYIYDKVISK